MGDFLVELGANATARWAIKKMRLPIPLPEKLRRVKGPWKERTLANLMVFVHHGVQSELAPHVTRFLDRAGANVVVFSNEKKKAPYRYNGETDGRLPLNSTTDGVQPHALIFDATDLKDPTELVAVYDFFHQWISLMRRSGRILLLSRPPQIHSSPAAAATVRALDGFIRSMAREIGKKGSTAQRILVNEGAEAHLESIMRFLLSERSVYISAQTLHVTNQLNPMKNTPYRKPLSDKVALVTGAARGIGASIAKSLAREGAHIILVDRPQEENAAGKLASQLGGTLLLLDITDPGGTEKIRMLLRDNFHSQLDIIVHNAGITRDKTLAKMNPELWNQVFDVNLISLIRVNEMLLPHLREGGRIVCLSSVSGLAGNFGQTNYAASKAGLIGYVRALAPTLADKGITVNAVAPGFIETKMTAAMPMGAREVARRLCNLVQGGLPEDVAETVTFLVSPGATGLTGEVLRICGGSYIGS